MLVDRLWPRGLKRSEAPFSIWAKDVAPSAELRKSYGHAPGLFDEFAHRYRGELRSPPASVALEELGDRATTSDIVLLTAAKDIEHSHAAVLRDVLRES